jgi:putative hydrolase of HD superfamily
LSRAKFDIFLNLLKIKTISFKNFCLLKGKRGKVEGIVLNLEERKMEKKKIVNFLFEVLSLKQVPRSGWTRAGIKNPESVAEHSFCASQIAYFLAKMEKADPAKAVLMTLFHDNGEARVGDANLLQKCYFDISSVESEAFLEQIEGIPGSEEIKNLHQEYLAQEAPEAKIAYDADKLELCLQAKFYLDQGVKVAQMWIDNVRDSFKTRSARELLKIIEKTNSNQWWQEIKRVWKRMKKK